jgi:hypothetical protein
MHDTRKVPVEEWVALLSISDRFDFQKIVSRAIREIDTAEYKFLAGRRFRGLGEKLDPITKIALALKHDVTAWLAPAYEELCQRVEPIDEREGEILGMKLATMVMRARELVRDRDTERRCRLQAMVGRPPPTDRPYPASIVHNVVQEVFFPLGSSTEKGSVPASECPPVGLLAS